MEESTQFNINLQTGLVNDLDFITNLLKISRNDWLKFRLAQLIAEEKYILMGNLERRYMKGQLSEEEFAGLLESDATGHLSRLRNTCAFKLAIERYLAGLMTEKEYDVIFGFSPTEEMKKNRHKIEEAGRKFYMDFLKKAKEEQ